MKRFILLTIHLFLLAQSAQASQPGTTAIKLPYRGCINASSLTNAVQSITNYTDYPSLPGATLSTAGIVKLKMVGSLVEVGGKYINEPHKPFDKALNESLTPTRVGERKKVSIATKLYPAPAFLSEDQSKFFPKFWINCDYGYTSTTNFEQECHQDLSESAARFAVVGFDSTLKLSTQGCESGQIKIEFDLLITTDDAQIEQIKSAIQASDNPVKRVIKETVIKAFFDQKNFLLSYFQNFYDGWAKSL